MAEVASAFVSLMPSAKGFGRASERQIAPQMNGVAKRTGSRFGKVFASATMSPLRAIGAAAIGLFAVAKVKQFFQGAIAEARESQKVSAITAQVIKSTGGAANVSAAQVGRLAGSISKLTGIDDEAIQAGSNLLLTFTNLRNEAGKGNDVFNQATKIITDMSVALGTDVKGSAIQVGKALNDPIKGISALTRVGVSFTEQQKDQITKLTESGKRLAAQKIILGELRKEFGGTAAAAATAGDRFRTTFANFQEVIGLALLPYLDRLLDKGTAVLNFLMTQVPPAFASFKASIAPVAAVIGTFVNEHLPAFKTALAALGGSALTSVITLIGGGLFTALTVLVGALTSPIALIGALAGAAIYAYLHFENFRTSVNNLAAFLQANVLPALVAFGNTLRSDVLPAVVQFATWLATKAYPAAFNFWTAVGQRLQPALVALGQTIKTDVAPAVQALGRELQQHQPAIQKTAQLVIRLEAAYGTFSSSMLGKVLPTVVKVTGFLIGSHLSAVASVIDIIFDWVGALGRLGSALGKALGEVKGFVNGAISALSGLYDVGAHAADQLVSGLVAGLRSRVGEVAGAIAPLAGIIKDHFPGSPVKTGPLTSWNNGGAGKRLVKMLADGIVAGTPGAVSAAVGMATGVEKAVLGQLTSMRDGVKGILSGLRSDFESLKSSIASTFTGDLFSSTNAAGFLTNLTSTRMNLGALSRAFKKLEGWGLRPDFLAQLFQSGNGALILDLAAGTRRSALNAGTEFGAIQSLSQQLGGQVARDSIGPKIDKTNDRLERIERAINRLPKGFGRELNGAMTAGHRGSAA